MGGNCVKILRGMFKAEAIANDTVKVCKAPRHADNCSVFFLKNREYNVGSMFTTYCKPCSDFHYARKTGRRLGVKSNHCRSCGFLKSTPPLSGCNQPHGAH